MRFIIIFAVLTLFSNQAASQQNPPSEIEQKILFQAQKFKYILETAYRNYVDSFDIEQASDAAFDSFLKNLDKESEYLSVAKFTDFVEKNAGATFGIGINVIEVNDTCRIWQIYADSPADSAGLKTGDKILFLDGENAIALGQQKLNEKLRGEEGSRISVIIKRGASSSLQEAVLTRREVTVPSVNSHFILEGTTVGYVQFIRFTLSSEQEVTKAVNDLLKKGMKSCIIDLRGNPGGAIEIAAKVAERFLPGGKLITFTRARNDDFDVRYETRANGEFNNLPLMILIDNTTASSAEIFAGVMQDYDRAIIIGERSYGKGTAQKLYKMADGSGFKITVASYNTPIGREIQKTLSSDPTQIDPSLQLNMSPEKIEQLKKRIAEFGGHSLLPTFTTGKGRTLIGGGGIFPDFAATNDTTTLLTRVMIQKRILAEFIFNYLEGEGSGLLDKYKGNLNNFIKNFQVTDTMFQQLYQVSLSKNTWNQPMFETDKNYLAMYIKASLAFIFWGEQGFHSIIKPNEKPIKEALRFIPEAVNLLK